MDYIIEDRSVVEMVVVWEIRQRSRHTIWWPSSIRATYPAHGWSLGGARPRWGSPRRARAAAAPRPGTAPSSAPPRSRPPTRWPHAGPPTRAACGRRGYARSSRERERERAVPHQDAGSEGNGGVCEGAKFSQMQSGGHTRITVKIIEKIANNRWKQPNWISNTSKLTCRIDNTDE